MGSVFTTTYEIIGEGIARTDTFYKEQEVARNAHWEYVKVVGGDGFRPSHDGGIQSVFFKGGKPVGWRRVAGRGERIECVPNHRTKAGKGYSADLNRLPHRPTAHELGSLVGYNPRELPTDGYSLYFPTELRTLHPVERRFLRIPRKEGDGFAPDAAILKAIPESEFMAAVEAHNAEARREREATQ